MWSYLFSSIRGAVEFSMCMDLKNPWNDNKPVKISRDGQVRNTSQFKLAKLNRYHACFAVVLMFSLGLMLILCACLYHSPRIRSINEQRFELIIRVVRIHKRFCLCCVNYRCVYIGS
jgi:hypothetical protein